MIIETYQLVEMDFCAKNINNTLEIYERDYFIFPVYLYSHSGISISLDNSKYPFNDKWDTSMNGYILVSKLLREDIDYDSALSYAESLINNWNKYFYGDIYRYEIYDENNNIIDSCGGFYDIDECEDNVIDYINNIYEIYFF